MIHTALKTEPLVGIRVLDDQHEVLFENIRRLRAALAEGKGLSAIPEILQSLDLYGQYHFGTEERLMNSYGYPLRDTHAVQHLAMRAQMIEIKELRARGDLTASLRLLEALEAWLEEHIKGWDAQMGSFLRDRGLS